MPRNGFQIMDCDIHVDEPPDMWERYIEHAYLDRIPKRIKKEDEYSDDLSVWQFEGK